MAVTAILITDEGTDTGRGGPGWAQMWRSILPFLSSQPLSRCRSTPRPRRWPALLPVALGAGLVLPSRRSVDACCACKSERATARLLSTAGKEEAHISQECMQALKLSSVLKARVKPSISYSQNSTTALVRFVVSTMEWFV